MAWQLLRIDVGNALENINWLLSDGNSALIVDPTAAGPVIELLEARSLVAEAVLITHLHLDHYAGLPDLRARYPDLEVYGPGAPAGLLVGEGDKLSIAGLKIRVMAVPGHTPEHLAYLLEADQGILASGDLLFPFGCGNCTKADFGLMMSSLDKLVTLEPRTVYLPGHDLMARNYSFFESLVTDPVSLAGEVERELPISLGVEMERNPFLRVREQLYRRMLAEQSTSEELKSAALQGPEALFAWLRQARSRF